MGTAIPTPTFAPVLRSFEVGFEVDDMVNEAVLVGVDDGRLKDIELDVDVFPLFEFTKPSVEFIKPDVKDTTSSPPAAQVGRPM